MDHPSFRITHKARIIRHGHFNLAMAHISQIHAQRHSMGNSLDELPGNFCFFDHHHRSLFAAHIYGSFGKISKPLCNAAV